MDGTAAIDIAPLEHVYKSITYTCAGLGLLKDGFEYDPHPEKFFPPKPAKASKAGTAPKLLQVEKKPAGWWKAQCAFRGLNQSGAINDIQLRLKEAKKKMLPELKEVETQLNKDFKNKNKSAKDSSWKLLKSAEQKATKDPYRFLVEAFPKGATGRPANLDIVVLKVEGRAAIHMAAEKLGLETVSVDAPWTSNKKPSPDRWIIVGRTRDAVWNQMRETEREALRFKDSLGKQKSTTQATKSGANLTTSGSVLESLKKKNTATRGGPSGMSRVASSASNSDPSLRPKQTARRGAPFGMSRVTATLTDDEATTPRRKQTARRGAHSSFLLSRNPPVKAEGATKQGTPKEPRAAVWDVTGSYEIDCPEIQRQWDSYGPMTLQIYLENIGDTYQMYANFHFNVVEGIFRFEKPRPGSGTTNNDSRKRKREDEDEDEDVELGSIPTHGSASRMSERIPYTAKVFHLGPKDKPTARRPTWQYRWRGNETGEGVIELGSDQYVQTITFSERSKELSGNFNCNLTGNCSFKGVKVGSAPVSFNKPEAQWDQYSERAYEEARVNRWH